MISKQGQTLQGVGLTQGNIQVSSGEFLGATTFYCHVAGDVEATFIDTTTKTISLTAREAFPIVCKSLKVVSGSFSIGFD